MNTNINYQFKHPNNGWQGVQAECDARNFALLMNWPVRTFEPGIFDVNADPRLFRLVVSVQDFTLWEVVTTISDLGYVGCHRAGEYRAHDYRDLRAPICEVVQTCVSSDPAGMSMPLTVKGGDIWMLPVPEEVFGRKGVYVRILRPKEMVL